MPAKLVSVRSLLPVLSLLLWAVPFPEQAMAQPTPSELSPTQAQTLVDGALDTELRLAQDLSHPMRYRLRKSSPRLTTTKEIVETKDGDVARLVSVFDKPLDEADEQKEQARLDALLSDPNLQQHRKQSEDKDFGIIVKLLRMLPKAFLYQYAGVADGPAGPVQKFTFSPNPHFNPPDMETQALTAMTGELWIDASQQRVTRLEGHLQQDTNYGWGILGKLNKGGWVVLEQSDIGENQWRIARFKMQISLRILFENKNFDTEEQMTQYAPVPANIDYKQAIQMLRSGSASAK